MTNKLGPVVDKIQSKDSPYSRLLTFHPITGEAIPNVELSPAAKFKLKQMNGGRALNIQGAQQPSPQTSTESTGPEPMISMRDKAGNMGMVPKSKVQDAMSRGLMVMPGAAMPGELSTNDAGGYYAQP